MLIPHPTHRRPSLLALAVCGEGAEGRGGHWLAAQPHVVCLPGQARVNIQLGVCSGGTPGSAGTAPGAGASLTPAMAILDGSALGCARASPRTSCSNQILAYPHMSLQEAEIESHCANLCTSEYISSEVWTRFYFFSACLFVIQCLVKQRKPTLAICVPGAGTGPVVSSRAGLVLAVSPAQPCRGLSPADCRGLSPGCQPSSARDLAAGRAAAGPGSHAAVHVPVLGIQCLVLLLITNFSLLKGNDCT